jgi:hypothetical protein
MLQTPRLQSSRPSLLQRASHKSSTKIESRTQGRRLKGLVSSRCPIKVGEGKLGDLWVFADIRLGSQYYCRGGGGVHWRGRIGEEDRGRVAEVAVGGWGGRGRRGGGNSESPPPLAKEAGTGPGQTYLPAPHRPLVLACWGPRPPPPPPSTEGCVISRASA